VIDQEGIDPTAQIDSAAEIGEEVAIGPNVVIGPEVRIGDRCRIGAGACIEGPTTLGPENIIYPMASIGGEPQDLKFDGEKTTLSLGARNRIREYVTINRGTAGGGGRTVVGDDNLMMVQTQRDMSMSVPTRPSAPIVASISSAVWRIMPSSVDIRWSPGTPCPGC